VTPTPGHRRSASTATCSRRWQEISNSLNDRLTKTVNETPFGQYSEGKRFLRSLDDAIRGAAAG